MQLKFPQFRSCKKIASLGISENLNIIHYSKRLIRASLNTSIANCGYHTIISVSHKKKYIEGIGIYATNLYFRKQMHLCATKCSVKLIKIPIKERIIFIHHNNTIKDIFVVFHCKMNNIVIPKKNYLRAIFLSIGSSDANCPHNSICKGKKGS